MQLLFAACMAHQGLNRDQLLRWPYDRLSLLLRPEWILRLSEGGSLNWVFGFLHLSVLLSLVCIVSILLLLIYSTTYGTRAPLGSLALRLEWRYH